MSLEPGAKLNRGEPVEPRQAATVIVLRGGSETLEVLLAKRNPAQRFMGGAWVFPGGAVDAAEGEGDAAHRAAGVREVAEETGVAIDPDPRYVASQPWPFPTTLMLGFHAVYAGGEPHIGDGELEDVRWFTRDEAREALADRGPYRMPPLQAIAHRLIADWVTG